MLGLGHSIVIETCLSVMQTRDLKLLPISVRGQLGVRRMCRKRIHDRIIAVSGNVLATSVVSFGC